MIFFYFHTFELLWKMKGTFFPAVASLSSRNLASRDRSFFFSSTTAGASVGTLLTGTLGKKSLIAALIKDGFIYI